MITRSDHSLRRNLQHWIAGSFVALAVIFCVSYNPVREFGDRREVVVASREILPGEKITAERLTIAPVPNGSVPKGAFRKLEQVVGRVAITPIGESLFFT
jgi:Flp pilus assembly protein CpaB